MHASITAMPSDSDLDCRSAGAFDASGNRDSNIAVAKAFAQCQGSRKDNQKYVATVFDSTLEDDVPQSVKVRPIMAVDIRGNSVGKQVWADFLPLALKTGKYFIPFPQAHVVGTSLDEIQSAMDAKAPSGKKVVVALK